MELGYKVVEVVSAEAAMEQIENGLAPDLLVTDHMMAGMNGTELVRRVLTARPRTRVLIVSGYAEMDDIAPDLPRLSKPFKSEELARALTG